MNDRILHKYQNLCSRREYCTKDITSKLMKDLEGDSAAVGEMLESLKKERYVDDLRYASAFARDKSHIQGWGGIKISYMLRAKGIDQETIREALAEIEQDKSDDRLLKLLKTKNAALKDDPQKRLKLLRYALGRGYDYESVSKLLSEL